MSGVGVRVNETKEDSVQENLMIFLHLIAGAEMWTVFIWHWSTMPTDHSRALEHLASESLPCSFQRLKLKLSHPSCPLSTHLFLRWWMGLNSFSSYEIENFVSTHVAALAWFLRSAFTGDHWAGCPAFEEQR